MIRCPKCDADSRTTGYSRYIKDNNMYIRSRKCINCDYKFKTVELMSDDYNNAIDLYNDFTKLMKKFVD